MDSVFNVDSVGAKIYISLHSYNAGTKACVRLENTLWEIRDNLISSPFVRNVRQTETVWKQSNAFGTMCIFTSSMRIISTK